jgi:ribonucleoside-diphosphate reductase beta chain
MFSSQKTSIRHSPELFDETLSASLCEMIEEAVDCEMQFAEDLLSGGVAGLSTREMRQYLRFVADQRLTQLGVPTLYQASNPFPFMELQNVQELANFFERRVSAYQVGVTGQVALDEAF